MRSFRATRRASVAPPGGERLQLPASGPALPGVVWWVMVLNRPSAQTQPSDATLYRVLGQFGFAPESIDHIAPLPRRIGNENFRVRANAQDWVLKAHRSAKALNRLRVAHSLELELARSNFPVAHLQRCVRGGTLVQDGTAHYSLHSWVEGKQIAIADRDSALSRHPVLLHELASTLGTLHWTAGTLEHSGEDPPTYSARALLRSPHRTARRLRRIRPPRFSRWHTLRFRRNKSDFDRWILRLLPEIAASAERLARRSEGITSSDSDLIISHHDINWENLIFSDSFALLALLDFDNVIRAPRALEVGSATVVLAGADSARVELFLGTYEKVAQHLVDRQLFSLGMRMKCTQSILNSINTYLHGRVVDVDLLASWCYHLYESLQVLEHR